MKRATEANEPVAAGVKRIIKRKGLKQRWVAEQAGFTSAQLTNRLTGECLIKASEIQTFAHVLGVGVEEIFAAGMEERDVC